MPDQPKTFFGYDSKTLILATGYCLTSSLLSIINKFAVQCFPYPSALTGLQYLTSAGAVYAFGVLGFIDRVDSFSWSLIWQMAPVVFCFYVAVFSNVKVLQHANVETFIVLRSTTPIVVAIADAIFRPHAAVFPSSKTWLSLLLIMLGATGYVLVDSQFSTDSYVWGAIYTVVICTEMVWVKDIVSKIKLSNWGLVFYNNTLCLIVSVIASLLSNEGDIWQWFFGFARAGQHHLPTAAATATADTVARRRYLVETTGDVTALVTANLTAGVKSAGPALVSVNGTKPFVNATLAILAEEQEATAQAMAHTAVITSTTAIAITAVGVSCLFGLGISFFGFATRRTVSATGFTVMGCTNKLLTLLVNSLVWSKHASLSGQACVLVSIMGGVLYSEFAKADTVAKQVNKQDDKVDAVPLLHVKSGGADDDGDATGGSAKGGSAKVHQGGGGGAATEGGAGENPAAR